MLSFSRSVRLTQASEYQEVFRTGKRIRAPFSVFILRKNGLQKARLGLIVAKKHLNKAILRNYLKRKLRELFRHYQVDLNNIDLIWLAQKNMSHMNRPELKQYLELEWQKLISQLKTYYT